MTSHDGGAVSAHRYHEETSDAQLKLSVRSIPELKRAESREELASVGLLSTLENDTRSSFVVDISSGIPQDGILELAYFNSALAGAPALLAKLRGDDASTAKFVHDLQPRAAFAQWIWGHINAMDPAVMADAYLFSDHLWWATTIAVGRYRAVSGVSTAFLRQEEFGHKRPHSDASINMREQNKPKSMPQYLPDRLPTRNEMAPASSFGPFDYTQDPPCQNMSDHVLYFRSIDWSSTPLGPMASWSPQLRCVVNMILNDHYHAVLFWGEEATMIYNEAYVELIGGMHPCMGQSAPVVAKEFWPHLEPLIQLIKSTGKTFSNADMPLFLDRHGFLEEAFFSFQFVPVLDASGCVAGYYQPLVETTRNQILERRITSLVEIGSKTAKARDLKTYWDLVIDTLAINDRDAPFALLYAAEDFSVQTRTSVSTSGISFENNKFVLKGSIGVDAGHSIAPPTIDLENDRCIFGSHLKRSVRTMTPVVVHFSDMELPEGLLDGIYWKGFGDPCRSLIICPIQPTNSEHVQGFLILGVNPRRPFDEDYKQFVHVMLRLLATSLASVVLFDEEIRQKETAIGQAAQIQEQLVAELNFKEKKFQRYADQSDVAIFVIDSVGAYNYRNQSWYDLFDGATDAKDVADTWALVAWPEDIALCEDLLSKLGVHKSPICFELKTRMRWKPPKADPASEPDTQVYWKWVFCSAYPELDANNEVIEIVGNVSDISKQKWAEDVQRRRTDSALESKKHLEHFIDTTSHEMRNPLSAIMQCADGILTSCPVTDGDFAIPSPVAYGALLEQTVDAAQTIAQCAQHMKRIVDDILTISKLDSGLLIITPIDAQPEIVAQHAVKMFEGEAKVANVDLSFRVDDSCRAVGINWVSLDPTRLLQILINLITNALKFSRFEPEPRRITVTISANEQEPTNDPNGIHFEPKLVDDDSHLVEDWKQGSLVYLRFSVTDTGRGLTEDERSNLFARFSQASPRTHIHYGGSGLGLFISRRLTEMQGGAIGLASEFNEGSTFSFYIKARRAASNKLRRSSIPNIFPEDMRHRATTRREISKMNSRPESPVSEKSPTHSRWPSRGSKTQPPNDEKSVNWGAQQRPPAVQRRQSIMHPAIPNDAIGLPPEPDLAELKRTRSAPEDLHVLVVEDNLVNQKVLANQLRKLGCVVSVANHGGEALDFLKTTSLWRYLTVQTGESALEERDPPIDLHLILMDWEMPVMNGLTAVTKIRQFERGGQLRGHTPIIGVTANVREQQIQAAMDVGMDDVVSKPFRVSELMERMRGVVEGVGSGEVRWKGAIPEKDESQA
ncbi:hsp90-like protein [Paraphaeosphaeria minitans]|uniref:Hsp90-like protein n=1 Tax=Paraphaeosphaeria minitans TaxID=565426 RepID=A0A9P6G4B5_9PLEO|nr:hsp90-like protein [Paraphaeosphaeria minitans]